MKTKIFISYAREDTNKMKALYKALSKPESKIFPIVSSKINMPGAPLSDKVMKGIEDSSCFLPIITESSIKNQWVNQEIGYAIAKNKVIYPLVDDRIIHKLKGFIHDQIDLPFTFTSTKSTPKREAHNFRKCYRKLLGHLFNFIIKYSLISNITPKSVKQGEKYATKVQFKGRLKNGFFDNLVRHLDSKWKTWNWDKGTLINSGHTTPGELHGDVDIEREYTWPTNKWPKGKYKIFVRVYDHLTPGEIGRVNLIENIHDFEVL